MHSRSSAIHPCTVHTAPRLGDMRSLLILAAGVSRFVPARRDARASSEWHTTGRRWPSFVFDSHQPLPGALGLTARQHASARCPWIAGRGRWGVGGDQPRARLALTSRSGHSDRTAALGLTLGSDLDLGMIWDTVLVLTPTSCVCSRAPTGLSSRVFQLAQLPALLGCGRACKCSACSGSSRAQFGSRGEGRCPRASSSHGRSLPVHPHAHTSCSLQVRKAWLPGILHVRAQNPSQVRPLPMSCTLTCLRTQD